MIQSLNQLLSELNEEAPAVRAAFDDLFDPTLETVPIPFFGNILGAKVITIGLNPSDGEIRLGRWPRPVGTPTLTRRLTRYFSDARFPPHPWFDTWEQSLGHIGVSYANGTAAHVDVCPWPTRPMSNLPNQNRFLALVTQSLPWFWRSMGLAMNLRLVLMAGTATNKYYLNEFLAKMRNASDMAILGEVKRVRGGAFMGYQELRVAGKDYPLFFCSVSPSSRKKKMLPVRVSENRNHLKTLLV